MNDFKGANNPRWKDGIKMHGHGYRLIASPKHPFKDKQGYVREHRLIMELYIGRYLNPEEDVHHLNHDKTDNRIENLVLCANRSEHLKKFHRQGGYRTWFKKGEPSTRKNGKIIECNFCKKEFYVSASLINKRIYCSLECKYKMMKGKKIGYSYVH